MPLTNASNGELTISIVVPHYNDELRLRRCLKELEHQIATHAPIEVVVVDNNSPKVDLEQLAVDFPWAKFVTEIEQGAAAARNRGIIETTGTALLFIDADCVPSSVWLTSASQIPHGYDIIGGRIDVFDETEPPRSGAEAFETVFAFNNRRYIEQENFTVTANLLARRSIFDEVGVFKPRVSEDKEWCQRAVKAGFRIEYADAMSVRHPSRSDWPALKKKWRRLTDEAFALQRDQRSNRLAWLGRASAVLVSPLVHMHRVIFSPKLNSLGERLRGLATLFRLRAHRAAWMIRQSVGR